MRPPGTIPLVPSIKPPRPSRPSQDMNSIVRRAKCLNTSASARRLGRWPRKKIPTVAMLFGCFSGPRSSLEPTRFEAKPRRPDGGDGSNGSSVGRGSS
eukprot:scaffold35939_cov59-Phaeocystis_antarctica.AAC.2